MPDPKALSGRLQEFIRYSELKQMAYNIAALQQQKMFHSLAVLSFFPQEGKSLFCVALALAYAEASRSKVLIVDTATFHQEGSLVLSQCLNGSQTLVEVMSLEDLRKGSSRLIPPAASLNTEKSPFLEAEIVKDRRPTVQAPPENDFNLLKKVAHDGSKGYGLVLLDTASLNAKNKSNIDPLLVARLSDASVLIVSREFLNSRNVTSQLKMMEDPALHLLGIISNEAYSS